MLKGGRFGLTAIIYKSIHLIKVLALSNCINFKETLVCIGIYFLEFVNFFLEHTFKLCTNI